MTVTLPLELPSGRYKLDNHQIIDPETSEVLMTPQQYWRDSLLVRSSKDYFKADKKIGGIPSSTLVDIALNNLILAESQPGEEAAEFYELAGSALIEASFSALDMPRLGKNAIDAQDDRIALVDEGINALRQAQQALGEDNMTTYRQRLQLKIDFEQAYKDVACEELTPATVEEICELLLRHLLATHDNTDPRHARGFGGELRDLFRVWSTYKKPGDAIALPATIRGDSGTYKRNQTHDLDIIHQSSSGEWIVDRPNEVKRRKISQWMIERYTGSNLVYIAPDGRISVIPT
ncbi:MAG: hypothetical protein JWM00_372 [Candidatus Saccharibacteria bacterium]|nr:hypothetical protein [Candidatus Saccharibacteria bacterium]